MSECTPGPYIVGADLDGRPTQVVAPGSETVVADCACLNGLSLAESHANAAFIVRACNAHDELLAVANKLAAWDESHGDVRLLSEACSEARAAIRKAREE